MKSVSTSLIAVLFITFGGTTGSYADGLVKKLPSPGQWASYEVTTSIGQPDGKVIKTTGTLTVKALQPAEIGDKNCRWIEFELSWERPRDPDKEIARFHSSVTKIAIDESVFENKLDPSKAILDGISAKTSSERPKQDWNYAFPEKAKPGLGSRTGLGVIDYYLRSPFERSGDLGLRDVQVADKTLRCKGAESSETTHKLGENRKSVTTTAYRQWANDDTPFGVVEFHFETLHFDGTFFNQRLNLRDWGENAKSSLPDAE